MHHVNQGCPTGGPGRIRIVTTANLACDLPPENVVHRPVMYRFSTLTDDNRCIYYLLIFLLTSITELTSFSMCFLELERFTKKLDQTDSVIYVTWTGRLWLELIWSWLLLYLRLFSWIVCV